MAIEESIAQSFKPETRTGGAKLFHQEKLWLANASDTAIEASVKAAPPCKVRLATEDIGSETFTAQCNCAAAKKGQLCKHIWATLLGVAEKYPDFLSSKHNIATPTAHSEPRSATKKSTIANETYQSAAKARAADYRKDQYQKHKDRAKAQKRERQSRPALVSSASFPEEVETALAYFSLNGFPMPAGPDEAIINEAKKKLSRVFHPDKGGSNAEVIELNNYCQLLLQFLQHS